MAFFLTAWPALAQVGPRQFPQMQLNDPRIAQLRQRMMAQTQAVKQQGNLRPGYYANMRVQAPTALDWRFVLSHQSLDPTVMQATAAYQSNRQTYELFVPPPARNGGPYGVIVHVDAGMRSLGWQQWQLVCRRHNIIFAGAHNAGNIVPDAGRARIVLDVLDDVRRRFNVDPDRTYITGMSGGAHFACQIGNALPELFGGIIPVCGAWNLRVEQALRQRMRERISVALLTGTADFNGPEMAKEFYPVLQAQQIRSRVWVYPGVGHGYPAPAALEEVFQWVEAALPQRRQIGARFPASRMTRDAQAGAWSTALLIEGVSRLQTPGFELSGLFQLIEVKDRWQGLPEAQLAQQLLDQFDSLSTVPWKEIYRQERLEFRYLQARSFDGTLNRAPPPGYTVPRINLVRIGIELWQEVSQLAEPNTPVAEEARTRLAALQLEAGG
jgi:acetyl esterase/lipase